MFNQIEYPKKGGRIDGKKIILGSRRAGKSTDETVFNYNKIISLMREVWKTKGETKMIRKDIVKRFKKTEDANLVEKWFGVLFYTAESEPRNAEKEFNLTLIDKVPGVKDDILEKAKRLEKEEIKAKEEK